MATGVSATQFNPGRPLVISMERSNFPFHPKAKGAKECGVELRECHISCGNHPDDGHADVTGSAPGTSNTVPWRRHRWKTTDVRERDPGNTAGGQEEKMFVFDITVSWT